MKYTCPKQHTFEDQARNLLELLGLDPSVTIQFILVRSYLERAYVLGMEDGFEQAQEMLEESQ